MEAKSKVGSTDNIKHKAGGGNVKVGGTHQRILIKASQGAKYQMNKAAVIKGTFQVTQDRLFVNDESGLMNATQQCGGGLLLSVDDLLVIQNSTFRNQITIVKTWQQILKCPSKENISRTTFSNNVLEQRFTSVYSHSWSEIDEHIRRFTNLLV